VSSYYSRLVYRFFSKLDDKMSFDKAEEARESDRALAILLLADRRPESFVDALKNGDIKLVAALRFLADEIEDAGRESVVNPPETF
jgi:hypothetical protein